MASREGRQSVEGWAKEVPESDLGCDNLRHSTDFAPPVAKHLCQSSLWWRDLHLQHGHTSRSGLSAISLLRDVASIHEVLIRGACA